MVWKSWGRRLLLLAALLLCSGAAWAAGDVSLSLTSAPPRISRSASAVFAFQALQSSGWTCGDCAITCKLDGGSASDCGGGSSGNGNGTEVVSYAGLTDGNHTFTACATPRSGSANSTTCASYAWDVDTIPPTASVAADSGFTSSPNVSVLVSFSEPCPGAGGFTCNDTYCNLIVYGPGRVDPSTMEAVVPGLQYSVSVAASPDVVYGRLVIVMGRGFCTDEAGHRFRRTSNSSFTLRFDTRSDSMKITGAIPEKLLQIEGSTRVVEATNDDRDLRVYLSFAEPVMNSSAEILAALTATDAVLTPTNRSTLGNRRFGYIVNKISSTAVVTVACDASSIISRQGTPVYSSEPFTFLYDSQRPSVKLATSTVRTSSRSIPVLIKFEKPVFNFSSSAVQVSGGNLCSFHEASKSIYTMHIQAVDKLVSVQVAENTAQDVAGNLNLASDRLQVRHYSVPESSSIIATIVTVTFVATVIVATLLTLATSSLIASGAMSRPSSYSISEPSRNLLRMACHIQVFALSRWLSINLPVEYYELAKGIEWTIPYIRLPWEGPSADPFVGYSTMPAIAYSELVDRSDVASDPYSPRAMPMQIPAVDGGPVFPTQIPALDGRPLTAMEYRSFFQNQDMKPEAQIIMKLQDLDGWKYFGRNMLWLGVIGGGLILLHLLVLLYMRLRYRGSGTRSYGALVLPRLEIMLAILAMPCIAQASAALIRGGTAGGLAVGIVLISVLTAFLVALLLFLSLGITTGRLLQYKEVHQEGQEYRWYQELVRRTLGPGKRGQWTWKDPAHAARLVKLGPLFEDLRGPPKYMLTQIGGGSGGNAADQRIMASEDENEDAEAPLLQKVFGILRIYYTLMESVKRVALGIVAGAHASSGRSSRAHAVAVLAIASFQLFFLLLKKPFIRKRAQLVEIIAVASEVFVFAACLVLIDESNGPEEDLESGVGVGLAMLAVFALAFAAQACNEWNALYRQVQFLSPDRSSFLEGAKAASVGLLLLLLPSSALGDRVKDQQQSPPPGDGAGGIAIAGAGGGDLVGEAQRKSNERSWLGQLREMAKASFSRDGAGPGEDPSSSTGYRGKRSRSSSVTSQQSADAKAKGEWRPKSKALYKDLEAIFSNR